uniref:Cerato-platanin 12 n=2 Tax=Moniliophthora roreri TaxID=221103 RepID=S4UQF6_MONRR|nr:cerato-platanin 12 [Moniliophthora roreri]
MKFIAAIAILVTSVAALSFRRNNDGQTYKLRYITEYDDPDYPLSNVACTSGENGLLHKGLNKVRDIPTSASNVNVYVGGVHAVEGFNSEECGSCWEVYYQDKKIRVVAIDTAQDGFNVAKKGMDELTNGQAYNWGVVDVTARKLQPADCGLSE